MSYYHIGAIGTDIEVFLRDKTGNPVPVCGLLGGTKAAPKEVLHDYGHGFAVQEDNVMAEFNIPACIDLSEWLQHLNSIKAFLEGHFGHKGLTLDIRPSQFFQPAQLRSLQAQTFGCEPDYNVWKLEENDIDATNPLLKTMRTAGGHIHVSFRVDNHIPELSEIFVVVKALDLFLGVPSILLDTDTNRRKIYGKAGAFRIKDYGGGATGIEYRTLSNFWFATQTLQDWVYRSICAAFSAITARSAFESKLDHQEKIILKAIDDQDTDAAWYLINHWGLSLPKSFDGNRPKRANHTASFSQITANAVVDAAAQTANIDLGGFIPGQIWQEITPVIADDQPFDDDDLEDQQNNG